MKRTRIVCPSYRRAGQVLTRRLFPEAVLMVHTAEEDEYREKEGGEIVVLPDATRGNMAKVRNAMLDWAWSQTDVDQLVMLDDDIVGFGFFQYQGAERRGHGNHVYVTHDEAVDFIAGGFAMAAEMGVSLWGVNLTFDPRFYREYSPFSFLAPVLGPFSCHRRHQLRYDERLSLNEDYDFFLQAVHRDRRVLRFNKWFYVAKHLDQAGGVAAYRLLETERAQARVMVAKWGPSVVSYNFDRSTNPRVRVPIRGL